MQESSMQAVLVRKKLRHALIHEEKDDRIERVFFVQNCSQYAKSGKTTAYSCPHEGPLETSWIIAPLNRIGGFKGPLN